jgi:hypothetical protein
VKLRTRRLKFIIFSVAMATTICLHDVCHESILVERALYRTSKQNDIH